MTGPACVAVPLARTTGLGERRAEHVAGRDVDVGGVRPAARRVELHADGADCPPPRRSSRSGEREVGRIRRGDGHVRSGRPRVRVVDDDERLGRRARVDRVRSERSDVGWTDRMSPSGVSLSATGCAVSFAMSVVIVMVSPKADGARVGRRLRYPRRGYGDGRACARRDRRRGRREPVERVARRAVGQLRVPRHRRVAAVGDDDVLRRGRRAAVGREGEGLRRERDPSGLPGARQREIGRERLAEVGRRRDVNRRRERPVRGRRERRGVALARAAADVERTRRGEAEGRRGREGHARRRVARVDDGEVLARGRVRPERRRSCRSPAWPTCRTPGSRRPRAR